MPEIIRGALPRFSSDKPILILGTDRLTLAKRRWRQFAEDGRDFGFDLESPLHNGDIFFESETHCYAVTQTAEPVLEIPFSDYHDAAAIALLGWNIGNLHFPIEITPTCVRVADDDALRRLFEREHIQYVESVTVFAPSTSGVPHGHH